MDGAVRPCPGSVVSAIGSDPGVSDSWAHRPWSGGVVPFGSPGISPPPRGDPGRPQDVRMGWEKGTRGGCGGKRERERGRAVGASPPPPWKQDPLVESGGDRHGGGRKDARVGAPPPRRQWIGVGCKPSACQGWGIPSGRGRCWTGGNAPPTGPGTAWSVWRAPRNKQGRGCGVGTTPSTRPPWSWGRPGMGQGPLEQAGNWEDGSPPCHEDPQHVMTIHPPCA
eukprot:scaffold2858_cov659-Pavlova_lutheri.AAC.104